MGRYSGDGETSVTLTGNAHDRIRSMHYDFNFPRQDESNDFIPRLLAARKIGYLVGEIRLKGEKEELVNEIVRLSTEYGIVTPYSSYLIVDHKADFARWGIPKNMETEARKKGEWYMAAMSISTGDEAVTQSLDILSMKERAVVKEPDSGIMRYVGIKTFYLRVGVWVDGNYQEGMETEQVKFLSDRYFELLRENPAVAWYLASGKNVILVFGSKCYRIVE
jgi:Ca-activated chloride channel family protein